MSLIRITNLTFAYDGSYDNIFNGATFQIDTNWKLGLIGRNGKGKTTFLNLLLGKHEYTGNISTSVNFEYFPYPISDETQITQAVIQNIHGSFAEWELLREFSLLQLTEDVLFQPFGSLSKGEQAKVLLAVLFLKENHFLLIDEPTNHLDYQARKAVSNYLKSKKGFIVVSHDRAFLDGCVDHILSINQNDITVQNGNFSSWFATKEKQDAFEIEKNTQLKKEVARLKKTALEKSNWADKVECTKYGTKNSGLRPDRGYIGHKSAKMMKAAKSIEKRQQTAYQEKSKLLKNMDSAESLKLTPLYYKKPCFVSLENISIKYPQKNPCKNVTFDIQQGDRIALMGKNGSGKSSIIKLLNGENIAYDGVLTKGTDLVISYVPQDTSFLKGNLSCYAMENKIDESLFKSILRKLDFSRVQLEKDMQNFSAGQKKKVLFAKSLCQKAHLYLWDEPLNFIDVLSRIQIEQLISQFSPTILFVEHDVAFCKRVATKQIFL